MKISMGWSGVKKFLWGLGWVEIFNGVGQGENFYEVVWGGNFYGMG